MLSEYKRPRKQYLMGGQQQLHSQRRHRQCVRRGGVRVAKYKLKFNPLTDLSHPPIGPSMSFRGYGHARILPATRATVNYMLAVRSCGGK